MDSYDYAVIGGGATGWIAARAIAAQGGSVVLIGPASVPIGEKYFALSWKTLQRLEEMGIDFIKADLTSYGGMREFFLGREGYLGWCIKPKYNNLLGINIHQRDLYSLCSQFGSHNIFVLSENIVSLSQESTDYIIHTQMGSRIKCRHIIAADGQNSFVRNTLRPKWSYLQRLSRDAYISMIPSMDKKLACYQYACSQGGTLAVLPSKDALYSYSVWTSESDKGLPFEEYVKIPLWSYQVDNSLQPNVSYIGWAGQSWDPASASGLNQAIFEIGALVEALFSKDQERAFSGIAKRVALRRKLISQVIWADRLCLSRIQNCPQSIVVAALELLAEQSLEIGLSLCPHVLI